MTDLPALPGVWEILDRMERAQVLLAWQRGNGADYPETTWWNHGIYSLYRVPDLLLIRTMFDQGLIERAECGDAPANVWQMRATAYGRLEWDKGRPQ